MRTRTGMTIGLCLLLCTAAYSQSAYFGPQLGIYNSADGDGSRVMGGLALRLKLSRAFGIEGSVNYRKEFYDGGHVAVQSWPVMVTALLYPIPMLYGAIGAGWYNASIEYRETFLGAVDYSETDTKQDFGWHFGGGVELPLGGRMRFVGDVRYVYLDYGFRQFPGTSGVNSDFYVITLGLLFRL